MGICKNCGLNFKIVGYHKNKTFCNISCSVKYRHKNGLMKDALAKTRLKKLGMKYSKEFVENRKSEGNSMWKGINVTRKSMHDWVNNNYGKLDECEHCHKEYKVGEKFDWSSKEHNYTLRGREHWQFLCRSCHMKYDYQKGFRKGKYYGKYKNIP